jgi:hypothetical protein
MVLNSSSSSSSNSTMMGRKKKGTIGTARLMIVTVIIVVFCLGAQFVFLQHVHHNQWVTAQIEQDASVGVPVGVGSSGDSQNVNASSRTSSIPKALDILASNRAMHHQPQDETSLETTTTTTTKSMPLSLSSSLLVATPNHTRQKEGFAACLLVKDDNHYFPEWLAYHQNTLPLRRLIVTTDPESQTFPTKILDRYRNRGLMDITEWTDDNFYPRREREAMRKKFSPGAAKILIHRLRQRHFQMNCMSLLKKENYTWVAMIDTDEYIVRNAQAEKSHLITNIRPTVLEMLNNVENRNISQAMASPCVPMHRTRMGTKEETNVTFMQDAVPEGLFNYTDFSTLRWRWHEKLSQGDPIKSMIDLSRVNEKEFRNQKNSNPHRPIKSYCPELNRDFFQSSFIAYHYYGTWEQWSYRDDARNKRTPEAYAKLSYNAGADDSARSWLQDFVQEMGHETASRLLEGAGRPGPKLIEAARAVGTPLSSISPSAVVRQGGNQFPSLNQAQNALVDGDAPKEPPRNTPPEERCAINLFGLPRAFQSFVLPSIIENVIRSNSAHNCDYFVHYFNLTQEAAGRSGKGGHLNTSEILLLEQHVQREAPPGQRRPKVVFLAEQEEDFWKKYEALINKTRNTRDSEGRFVYFPWKCQTYEYPRTVDNIIKMWHSIQSAWLLMEQHATGYNIQYTRVAMLRADVMYVTPIDIYRLDNGHNNDTYAGAGAGALFDRENRVAVVPSFAKYPVNDRMIYGPHAAVKIWAAERFARLETHVQALLKDNPGYGMHSERFLSITIFPAIRQAGIEIHENPRLCFFRVRSDETVWVSDCDPGGSDITMRKKMVERLSGRQCGKAIKINKRVRALDCNSH